MRNAEYQTRKPEDCMSGAAIIVKALQDQGVEVIFDIRAALYYRYTTNYLRQII